MELPDESLVKSIKADPHVFDASAPFVSFAQEEEEIKTEKIG